MRRLISWSLACGMSVAACHPVRPIIDTGDKPPAAGGTIAGLVSTADETIPLTNRKVTVVNTSTGARYDATTAINGGYTIRVPAGTYRIEVELRAGEVVTKQPSPTSVGNGDLDAGRDFTITAKLAGVSPPSS